MSALARYFKHRNVEVFGYDLTESSLTKKLETEGIQIHYKDDPNSIPKDIDLVIYTPAIPDTNQEWQWFKANNFPMHKRAEVLGWISQSQRCIAVAGTHGKTSTCSLITQLLTYCEKDISAFLGGILAEHNTNFISGDSDWVVLEADEYDRSFLHLTPEILVISSLDADHLDIYGERNEMVRAYEQLTFQVRKGGSILLMDDFRSEFSSDWETKMTLSGIQVLIKDIHFQTCNEGISESRYHFDFEFGEVKINGIKSVMPGLHNIGNASAALVIGTMLDIPGGMLKDAMIHFKGVKRRFEIVFEGDFILVDDYAHHPNELKYAIDTINNLYKGKRIVGLFQPHLYSRTLDFYKEFARELELLPEVWLLEIYPARELPIEGVESEMIYNLIRNDNKKILSTSEMLEELEINKDRIDVLFTIGASDIDKYHKKIIEKLK